MCPDVRLLFCCEVFVCVFFVVVLEGVGDVVDVDVVSLLLLFSLKKKSVQKRLYLCLPCVSLVKSVVVI